MSYYSVPEPCLCGADDCRQCHPENFEHGGSCDDDCDYDPGDWGDEGEWP